MRVNHQNGQWLSLTTAVVFMAVLQLAGWVPNSCAEPMKPSLSTQEKLRLGERIYREGILPTGEPMQAFVKGDLPVPGTSFTCVSCHLRSGLGSVEGGVVTPPTNGNKLYQPLQTLYKGIEQQHKYFPIPPRRPAYDDRSLAEGLRNGVDPAGRVMNDVMPRYFLDDGEMALLIDYLKSLSADVSPGVSDTTLRFATVIADDVRAEDRDAMLLELDKYVNIKNANATAYARPHAGRSRLMAEGMLGSKEMAHRRLSLARWVLKGPPETWRSQLEEYNRTEPVFALLGGITNGEWEPVHRFCEDHRIPSLFPITDFPVISATDWYTLYLSKGFYQEGEGAARYLNGMAEGVKGKTIVQFSRDSREGRALAAGFQETWSELGNPPPVTIMLKGGEAVTADSLQQGAAREKPAALLLWDSDAALPALETLTAGKNRPGMIIVSAGYLGKSIWKVKEEVRDFIYLTYPYRLPQDETKTMMGTKKVYPVDDTLVAKKIYSLPLVLNMALMEMSGNYYRDNFLDVIGMIMDQDSPLYLRLSFGPGQRYASKGCYVVQLGKGPKPGLVKKSEWVIH